MKDLKQYLNYLIEWITKEVKKAHCEGVIVGISGGIDSALVALLAKLAFPDNHLTVTMPCHSQKIDQDYAMLLVDKHNLNNQTVDLSSTYDMLVKTLNLKEHQLALANIKPRLRMTTLYALAQQHNYLVLGTDNADEWYVGYFTKYGDGGVDLVPIIHLLKSEVKAAAKLLEIPLEIIERAPTAGLWDNQTDESEMGFSYSTLDNYLQGKDIPEEIKSQIEKLHLNSMHKRQLAKAPENTFTSLIFNNFNNKKN